MLLVDDNGGGLPLKSWKIDKSIWHSNSLSILNDFRYQSIQITWLLSIFIDADFSLPIDYSASD